MPDETNAAGPDADEAEPPSGVPRPSRRGRQRIALIAGAAVAAMAATVAVIALTASPSNPYATRHSVCALISPATVAKYAPSQVHGKSVGDDCEWLAGKSGGLLIYAATVDSAAQARTGFTDVIQRTRKANTTKKAMVTGTRAVAGIGDQATAMFETSTALVDPGKRGSAVFLFVRSRNAVFQVVRTVADSGAVHPSSSALLPGAIAIAREVMAAMPTLGPGSPGVGVHITLDVSHPVGGGVILGDPGRGDQHRGIAE